MKRVKIKKWIKVREVFNNIFMLMCVYFIFSRKKNETKWMVCTYKLCTFAHLFTHRTKRNKIRNDILKRKKNTDTSDIVVKRDEHAQANIHTQKAKIYSNLVNPLHWNYPDNKANKCQLYSCFFDERRKTDTNRQTVPKIEIDSIWHKLLLLGLAWLFIWSIMNCRLQKHDKKTFQKYIAWTWKKSVREGE